MDEKCHYEREYFWNGPIVNLLSYCHIFHIEWLFMRNLDTVLPFKSKLSGKFQRSNAIDGSIKMLKNSWISIESIKG